MQELTMNEVNEVSGGLMILDPAAAGYAIIGLGFCGGPFTMGFGLAIGLGLIAYGG